jgi:N utilization substance protein A
VVQWREDTGQFIAEALGPAKVKEVHIDEETKTADVVVSEHQLSLAIGKEGQNARLAARLSGYKVDIRSDNEGVVEEVAEEVAPVEAAPEEAATEEVATGETPAGEAVTAETAPEEVSETAHEEVPEEVPEEVTETVELSEPGSDDEDAVVTADEDEESE